MIVYGTINGNINTHSLEIRSTGRITGDIKTQVLQVEPGGSHNGKLSMSAGPIAIIAASKLKHEQLKYEAVPRLISLRYFYCLFLHFKI